MPKQVTANMDIEVMNNSRKELVASIQDDGVHLHLYPGGPPFWRFCYQFTPLCHTLRCFKLKIKRFRRDTR